MNQDRGTGVPHGRAALLRLAAWFDGADSATAHRIATAAFAMQPARHLGATSEDPIAAAASWWAAQPADTSAVRPGIRGVLAPIEDHGAQQARLRDAAEAAAHWRRTAAGEARSVLTELTPEKGRLRLSGSALEVLMELLTAALGSADVTAGPVAAGDLELDIRLHVRHAPEAVLTIGQPGGDLTLEGLRLQATEYARLTPDPADPAPEEPGEAETPGSANRYPTPPSAARPQ
ncbi:hypothetical protein Nans01_36150 [Nocardiopsis ansamitocini]|uniref:DUF2397 family protein n=1 Tax=Nocardiopsis ansamitocini TaxID=1670832 RepID=A0A9W6UJV9_9ACTN|nr:hypothetical protein Nans01_36150 [Nocardiopsis ansamitocini]